VTASVTPNERDRVVAAGFNAYISKPIDVLSFGEQIDKLAGRVSSRT
jgi:CheY-like chemotaxis protein